MDPAIIGLIVAGSVVILGLLALVLRGRMAGAVSFLGIRMRLSARRDSVFHHSSGAVIEDSKSSKGGARASGVQNARISRTEVAKDLVAEAGPSVPKGKKRTGS